MKVALEERMRAYWSPGLAQVPQQTGAATVLDCQDLRPVLAALGYELPLRDVLDVGCGTGRVAQLCEGYLGVDISPDAVAYAQQAYQVDARVITGPDDLPPGPFALGLCLSVFTHVPSWLRWAYLHALTTRIHELVVDIIPGSGRGTVALWTADPALFEACLLELGWQTRAYHVATSPDRVTHAYYRLARPASSEGA